MLEESSTSCTLPFLQLVLLDWFLTLGEQFLGVYTVIYRLSLVDHGHPLLLVHNLSWMELKSLSMQPLAVLLCPGLPSTRLFPHMVIWKGRNKRYKKNDINNNNNNDDDDDSDEVQKGHSQATNQEILSLLSFLFIVPCPFIFIKTFILIWIRVTQFPLEFPFSFCHLSFQVSTSEVCFIDSTHFLGLLWPNTQTEQCKITWWFTVLEPRSPKSAHLQGSAPFEPELLPSLVLFRISSHVGLDWDCNCRTNSGPQCPKPQCLPLYHLPFGCLVCLNCPFVIR